jgi:hypothetical protein
MLAQRKKRKNDYGTTIRNQHGLCAFGQQKAAFLAAIYVCVCACASNDFGGLCVFWGAGAHGAGATAGSAE